MRCFEVCIVTLFSFTLALAIDDSQAANISISREKRIHERYDIDDLDFCYGEHSICESSNNLFSACDDFDNQRDLTPWYKCICGNGYVSTREACGWCELAYNISTVEEVSSDNDLNSAQCTSYSITIAPIPSTIIALESTYNATYTGTLPTGGSAILSTQTPSRTGLAATTIQRSSQTGPTATTSPKKSSSISSSTITLGGGGGSFTPLPTVTVTQTGAAGVGSGAEQSKGVEIRTLVAVTLFGVVAIIKGL